MVSAPRKVVGGFRLTDAQSAPHQETVSVPYAWPDRTVGLSTDAISSGPLDIIYTINFSITVY